MAFGNWYKTEMDANPSADDALDSIAEVWINSSHFILNYVQLENGIKLKRTSPTHIALWRVNGQFGQVVFIYSIGGGTLLILEHLIGQKMCWKAEVRSDVIKIRDPF